MNLTSNQRVSQIKVNLEKSPVIKTLFKNNADKYILNILTEISKSAGDVKKDLSICTSSSIITAIKDAYDLGFEVDGRHHCHLVRYNKNVGTKKDPKYISEARLQVGYRGFIYAIKKAYPDANIDCQIVYEGDELSIEKQNDLTNYHLKRNDVFAVNKKAIGAYCYVSYSIDGRIRSFCETLPISEINKIKGKAKQDYIWNEWFEEKAKVATIRRACKIHFAGLVDIDKLNKQDNQDFELSKTANVKDDIDLTFDKSDEKMIEGLFNFLVDNLDNIESLKDLEVFQTEKQNQINQLNDEDKKEIEEIIKFKEKELQND